MRVVIEIVDRNRVHFHHRSPDAALPKTHTMIANAAQLEPAAKCCRAVVSTHLVYNEPQVPLVAAENNVIYAKDAKTTISCRLPHTSKRVATSVERRPNVPGYQGRRLINQTRLQPGSAQHNDMLSLDDHTHQCCRVHHKQPAPTAETDAPTSYIRWGRYRLWYTPEIPRERHWLQLPPPEHMYPGPLHSMVAERDGGGRELSSEPESPRPLFSSSTMAMYALPSRSKLGTASSLVAGAFLP